MYIAPLQCSGGPGDGAGEGAALTHGSRVLEGRVDRIGHDAAPLRHMLHKVGVAAAKGRHGQNPDLYCAVVAEEEPLLPGGGGHALLLREAEPPDLEDVFEEVLVPERRVLLAEALPVGNGGQRRVVEVKVANVPARVGGAQGLLERLSGRVVGGHQVVRRDENLEEQKSPLRVNPV